MFRLIGAETWLHNFAFAEIFFHNTFFGFHFPTVLSTHVFTEPREKQSTVSDFIKDQTKEARTLSYSKSTAFTDRQNLTCSQWAYLFFCHRVLGEVSWLSLVRLEHVPTGLPCPSVSRKEWSGLGFYPGAPMHVMNMPESVCPVGKFLDFIS